MGTRWRRERKEWKSEREGEGKIQIGKKDGEGKKDEGRVKGERREGNKQIGKKDEAVKKWKPRNERGKKDEIDRLK